ncbi:hypothetical protein ACIBJI_41255 [Nocardia sp. NPDC050408]|uniref:hypothetical protein n=1 Tax=Nocardia sp. NPDC050408 TaxID=3364319 RepID=UPI0037A625CD
MNRIRFSSWAQTAVGQAIDATDGPGRLPAAKFTPGLSLVDPTGDLTPLTVPAPMAMLGPEGVADLDSSRAVVRTDPSAGAADVEDNYLASVDLRPVELPWMFTPAKPNAGRLRPWIVLVVVEVAASRVTPGDPVPTLSVGADQLPDLFDSWGWAHVQRADNTADQVARLMCPRRLRESTRYLACIVPAFTYSAATESYSPAWQIGQPEPVNLPIYYSWEFGTGLRGDFEYLVRRLGPAPKEQLTNLGTVFVDVHQPWGADIALSGAPAPAPYPVPGALGQLDLDGPPKADLPDAVTADFVARITDQCNAAAGLLDQQGGGDPIAVAPPIYGGRHAVVDRIEPGGGQPVAWVHELNASVPTRIAAGIGAEYIRAQQESLMARAWEQVGAIREANRRRALGQLAEGVTAALHFKHVATLGAGEAVSFAAPTASRIRPWGPSGPPLATGIEVSVMPTAAASTTFARMVRPGGPIARGAAVHSHAIIERAVSGNIAVPAARPVPSFTVADAAPAAPAIAAGAVAKAAVTAQRSAAAVSDLVRLQAISDIAQLSGLRAVAEALTANLAESGVDVATMRIGDITQLRAAVVPQLATVTAGVAGAHAQLTRPTAAGTAVTDIGLQLNAEDLRGNIIAALAAGDRIVRAVAAQISVPERLGDAMSLTRVMDHPTFPAPMALALRDFAPNWFLPGIADFPAESVTLLAVNNVFVESFLVGLAHEFNRELLWREYPTDLRGTPFRRFWPTAGGEPDIDEIHTWTGPLGNHLALGENSIAVLLVRGTVVRRFPSMVVAAAPAVAAVAGAQPVADQDPASWRAPLFALPIDEQTMVYAFEVPPDELRALPSQEDGGWFFAFQENSTRIRFGFDLGDDGDGGRNDEPDPPFTTWDDLTWSRILSAHPDGARSFARADAVFAPPQHPGDRAWNVDATDVARITLQKPFRVLVHASELVGR